MTRNPGGTSRSLQRRTFGTAGRKAAPCENLAAFGEDVDLFEEMQRRPVVLSATRPWKPRPGRVYNFPIRRAVEEK